MNLFAVLPHPGDLERSWILWDRWFLDSLSARAAIESLGPVFPFYLELCYLVVYAVSLAALVILYRAGRPQHASTLWLAYLSGTLGAYALFPYFPSDPPRVVFPGADNPTVLTWARHANLAIVGGYGIHSSVFPSAHVSSALATAWGLRAALPDRPWIWRAFAFYGFSVALSTVYGRYHYAVDALAGIAASALAFLALTLRPSPAPPPHTHTTPSSDTPSTRPPSSPR